MQLEVMRARPSLSSLCSPPLHRGYGGGRGTGLGPLIQTHGRDPAKKKPESKQDSVHAQGFPGTRVYERQPFLTELCSQKAGQQPGLGCLGFV